MRASDPPVQYLVGTPKGRLNRLEKHLIEKPLAQGARRRRGQIARPGRRTLRLRPEPGSPRQGARDAPTAVEMLTFSLNRKKLRIARLSWRSSAWVNELGNGLL